MLIRSQDKKDLVSLDDMGIVEDIESCFVEVYKHGVHCTVGIYSSLEKAIKVLDMIASAYVDIVNGSYQYVWDMPQDDEVIV